MTNSIRNLSRYRALISAFLVFLLLPFKDIYAQSPTVNGYFYGDGDSNRYSLWAEAPGARGELYYYIGGDTLYLAVVANDSIIADNVFEKAHLMRIIY